MSPERMEKKSMYIFPSLDLLDTEVPNVKRETVRFREMMESKALRDDSSPLCVGLGKDINGKVVTMDLSKMPHLLVAGTVGSGKTVWLNTVLAGIMYKARPDEVKLIIADTGMKELTDFNDIPYLLAPVITDAKKAASALRWAVAEMERRYDAMKANHVLDIKAYNNNVKVEKKMPYIVIVIGEMRDLMMAAKTDVEDAILRLTLKARACGIHMVLVTQRPSVKVITGIVKASIPSRIAFAVSSLKGSCAILDMGGAEKLLGKGDMLYYPIGANKPFRAQGAFISSEELNRVIDFIKQQELPVEQNDEVTNVVLLDAGGKKIKNTAEDGGKAHKKSMTDKKDNNFHWWAPWTWTEEFLKGK